MAVHLPQAQMEHTYKQHIPRYLGEKETKLYLLPMMVTIFTLWAREGTEGARWLIGAGA